MNNSELQNDINEVKVIDKRKKPFFMVDKYVIWNWIPFIGIEGYALYSLYISLVNKESGFAFPSLNQIARFLKRGKSTIVKYNALLEQYGLIRIERKINPFGSHVANNYYILDVPPIPDELIPELMQIAFIKKPTVIVEKRSSAEGGGHVQDQVVTHRTRGGHIQDQGGHVQDSKDTPYKETKKQIDSLGESKIEISETSLFADIPSEVLRKLADQYSPASVTEAVKSLEYAYRKRRHEVRSPLALLRTALKDGFEPVQDLPAASQSPQEWIDESDQELEEYVQKFDQLPKQVKIGWNRFLGELRKQMSTQEFETWFLQLMPTDISDGTLIVEATSPTMADVIAQRWLPQVTRMLKAGSFGFTALKLQAS